MIQGFCQTKGRKTVVPEPTNCDEARQVDQNSTKCERIQGSRRDAEQRSRNWCHPPLDLTSHQTRFLVRLLTTLMATLLIDETVLGVLLPVCGMEITGLSGGNQGWVTLRGAHILKRVVGVFSMERAHPAAATWNIIRHYSGMSEEIIQNMEKACRRSFQRHDARTQCPHCF
ncbi:uncharacterized protein EDB91DRAFT_834792 [Suillus paluster]|uniref:uncharacterized protein n=1 Tax=Suillus paluster TaxID=48578 RepID=UPI001B87BA59|nr:uncharacterized protein EDB91DRAFT_834792 [Suillus paluster]KAG1749114.1 hypothetical protein EDB91DRAFT_834792 [Suillus paluster]